MKYIGCDFHPSFQQVAMLDTETGELVERRLAHETGEVRVFYESLSKPVVVGVEASGNTYWFERLLAELGHELWMGDATAIRQQDGRKQKHDRRDAKLILKLMVKNQLQHIALNQGMQRRYKLWTRAGMEMLRKLELEPWARQRRDALLEMLEQFDARIEPLEEAVKQAAQAHPRAKRLQTHPGVGPVISLATVLTMGDVRRFPNSRSWVSYLGLNPSEDSSGSKRRLGGISKQKNPFLRYLLVEGAASAAKGDPALGRMYARLKARKHHGVAKIAVARKLAVRLYWMERTHKRYPEVVRMQGSPSRLVAERDGRQFE